MLARREAASRGSKDSSPSIIEGKRKRKKSTAACIIDTLKGTQSKEAQAKELKKALQDKSVRK